VLCRCSASALEAYPSFRSSAASSSGVSLPGSYSTSRLPAATFTAAQSTPGRRLSIFSTVAAQSAQSRPRTSSRRWA
jgi:hypothetical protein